MIYKFSERSEKLLEQCEPSLARVAKLALRHSRYDFAITSTLRTKEEQERLVRDGKSQTMLSRHLPNKNGLSEALDFAVYANGGITWQDRYYKTVIQAFFRAAIDLGVQIESGGLWQTPIDFPHIQLREA